MPMLEEYRAVLTTPSAGFVNAVFGRDVDQ